MLQPRPSVVTAGSSAASDLQLFQPVSVAAGGSETIYVLDWSQLHVVQTSLQGWVVRSWSVTPALAANPGSIAVDRKENVYVLRNVLHDKSYVGAITKY